MKSVQLSARDLLFLDALVRGKSLDRAATVYSMGARTYEIQRESIQRLFEKIGEAIAESK